MVHFCARRRVDGRFDYAAGGRPCGYCHQYTPIPEDVGWLSKDEVQRENSKMELLVHNFHDGGHATEEEACECYKKYLLDTRLFLVKEEPKNASQQNRCMVCNQFTACNASVGPYRMFTLCPTHQTRECVESLFKVGESWES